MSAGEAQLARRSAWLGAAVLLLLFALANPDHGGANAASRLATIESLVERGTFAIDGSLFEAQTVDKVKLGAHTLSTKPPLLPALGAVLYAALHHGLGLSFGSHHGLVVRLLVLLLMLLPQGLFLYWAFKALGRLSTDPQARLWSFALIATGFMGAGYATTLNNHSVAAACLMGGFYYLLLQLDGGEARGRDRALCGLLFGLAPTLDLPAAIFSAGAFLLLLRRAPGPTLRLFVPFASLPVLAHLALTLAATGSVLPIYARADLYRGEGSYWLAPGGMDALSDPKPLYLFHMWLGHHGTLSMTPIVALGLAQAARELRRPGPLAGAALLAWAGFLAITLTYLVRSNNYGGICVGLRWLIIAMPLPLLFLPRLLEGVQSRGGRLAVGACGAVSLFSMLNAAGNPWEHSLWAQAWSAF